MGQEEIEEMSWERFESACMHIVKQLKEKNIQFKRIYGIPRGGLCIAVRLSHLTGIPMIISFNECKEQNISHDDVLIVDDVSDTGNTLENFRGYKTATLYYKPHSKFKPSVHALETDKWVLFPWEKTDRPKK